MSDTLNQDLCLYKERRDTDLFATRVQKELPDAIVEAVFYRGASRLCATEKAL